MKVSAAVTVALLLAVAVATSRLSSAQPTASQWEYKTLVVRIAQGMIDVTDKPPPEIDPSQDPMLVPLAKANEEGWELVSVVHDAAHVYGRMNRANEVGYLYFLRRQKTK